MVSLSRWRAERFAGDHQVVALANDRLPHGDRLGGAGRQQLEEHAARILGVRSDLEMLLLFRAHRCSASIISIDIVAFKTLRWAAKAMQQGFEEVRPAFKGLLREEIHSEEAFGAFVEPRNSRISAPNG